MAPPGYLTNVIYSCIHTSTAPGQPSAQSKTSQSRSIPAAAVPSFTRCCFPHGTRQRTLTTPGLSLSATSSASEAATSRERPQSRFYRETFSPIREASSDCCCDVLVIDDPHDLKDMYSPAELERAVNYVRGTLFSRLNNPATGRNGVIMQRLHTNDLTGEPLNPSQDAGTERLEIKEAKSDPPRRARLGATGTCAFGR